jgi:hypothetical protein
MGKTMRKREIRDPELKLKLFLGFLDFRRQRRDEKLRETIGNSWDRRGEETEKTRKKKRKRRHRETRDG